MAAPAGPYVSRGGVKLAAALDAFGVKPDGLACADLGASTGGFTDCLLQRGARHVFAVDTGYGTLAWKLRNDRRVTVLERTNTLHYDPATRDGFSGCGLVVIDLGWTPQRHAIPAALRWLAPFSGRPQGEASPPPPDAGIITLIKPHYESQTTALHGARRGVLSDEQAQRVLHDVLEAMPALGVDVIGHVQSPIRGGGARGAAGNVEFLALLRPRDLSSNSSQAR